ncbi:MAG: hypothetical protein ACE364_06095 [Chlorobiota bacterium]
MRKSIIILFFTLSATLLLASTLDFSRLDARPEGDNVMVEWILGTESNVDSYELYRSNHGVFTKIAEKDAKGNNSTYKYIDVEAFIKNSAKQPQVQEKIDLKYKVKVIYKNGTSNDSKEITVSHNISSVKRTWGMIKELFR